MKNNNFMQKVSNTAHRVGFKIQKRSPEILVVTGVVGMVASAVMACKATTKISSVLKETKDTVDTIHSSVDNPNLSEKYTKEDEKKDLTIVYAKTGVKLAKLYAPSVVLGMVSITSILASSNIMRKRNVALAAAYATVDRSFKDYRDRVVKRFGDDIDRELRYDIKAETIEDKITDENGDERIVEKTVETLGSARLGGYDKIFDETNPNWEKNADYNLCFLRTQQSLLNQKLVASGHVFLNEVYDALGFNRTKAGQAIGWIFDPNDTTLANYIDFGLGDVRDPKKRAFLNGDERSVILSFNVDGNILSMPGWAEEA